jgi:hypothetical protein
MFNVIPQSTFGLNRRQEWFVTRIVGSYFSRQVNEERLAYFRQSAPAFTNNLQVPRQQEQDRPRDLLQERHIVSEAMKGSDANPINQTWRLLHAFARIEHGDRAMEVNLEDAKAVLARLPAHLKTNVLKAFRKCIESINYKKERREGNQFSMTRHEFEIPFWILRSEGERSEPEKSKEIVLCYGFSGSTPEEEAPYRLLLDEMRVENRDLWTQCVKDILEDSFLHSPSLIFRYLVDLKDPLYLERCSERLCKGLFSRVDFSDLLFYWRSFHPTNYCETLRACYKHFRVSSPASQTKITDQPIGKLFTNSERGEATVPAEGAGSMKRESLDRDWFDELYEFRPLLML